MSRSLSATTLRLAWLGSLAACTSGQRENADAAAPTDAAPVSVSDAIVAVTSPLADAARVEMDGGAADALTYDLGTDFSFARNPNGAWSYGYTVGATLAVDQFALDTYVADAGGDPIAFWHPANPATSSAGYYPYVAENTGSVSASEEASWALRPREVAMEGSNVGQYSVVRFVAPSAGTYQVQVHFEGIHFRLSSTDVHVVGGDAGLFASNIGGYGGDPAFHDIEGGSPSADFDGAVPLRANDVVMFAVGYGTNMTNYNDTTGLTVHIVRTGK